MNEQEVIRKIAEKMRTWEGSMDELAREIYQTVKKSLVQEVKINDFVTEFRELFPARRLSTGKSFKSNYNDLEKKLRYFVKNYDYPPDVILEAARQYVRHAESVGYEFIRTASYFVYKLGEGSDLADWCERVLNEEFHENDEGTHRLV